MQNHIKLVNRLFNVVWHHVKGIGMLAVTGKPYIGVVYVSGPMRGYVNYNYPAFHAATAYLRELGYYVISPAELGEVEGWEWPDYMRRDLLVVPLCTHIAMLPGYQGSKGAAAEHFVATTCGVKELYVAFDPEGNVTEVTAIEPEPERATLDLTLRMQLRYQGDPHPFSDALAKSTAADVLRVVNNTRLGIGDYLIRATEVIPHTSQATLDAGLDESIPGIAAGQQGA